MPESCIGESIAYALIQVQTTVDKAHRNKQLHSAYVTKAKEKYDSECSKQSNLEAQLPSALPRDADRLKNKLDRCRAEVETLGTYNYGWECDRHIC